MTSTMIAKLNLVILLSALLAGAFCDTNDFPPRRNAITVNDQTLPESAADRVTVSSVLTSDGEFLVIREDSESGPAIGYTTVTGRESIDVEVELDRDVIDGETLFAMLHVDDPSDGEYTFGPGSFTEDPPAVDENGDVVVEAFTVTIEAPAPTPAVTVADQTPDPLNQVVVASVTALENGWIVIHDFDDDGDLKVVPQLGVTPVSAGETIDVVVPLTRDVVDSETLAAMLHTEGNGNATYDGPANDPPVTDDAGNVIAPTFVVSVDDDPSIDSVTVVDQTADPAGRIIIEEVIASEDGWIVIHDQDEDGELVVVPEVGAAPVSQGVNTDVEVVLNRPVVDGETLFAMLHSEAGGDADAYDGPQTDPPVTDSNDEIVVEPFVVQSADNSITVADQTLDIVSTRVSVDSFVALADGYIVIYDDSAEGLGIAIGTGKIDAGQGSAVQVTLDRPALDQETLYARLHVEGGGDVDSFDGAATDPPATDSNGDTLAPGFVVSVPAGTPAIIFKVSAQGSANYTFDEVVPQGYEFTIDGGPGATDPFLSLRLGWRHSFEFDATAASHPIRFGNDAQDQWVLEQGNGANTDAETDPSIAWEDSNGVVMFTATSTLATQVSVYSSQTNPESMVGQIGFFTP